MYCHSLVGTFSPRTPAPVPCSLSSHLPVISLINGLVFIHSMLSSAMESLKCNVKSLCMFKWSLLILNRSSFVFLAESSHSWGNTFKWIIHLNCLIIYSPSCHPRFKLLCVIFTNNFFSSKMTSSYLLIWEPTYQSSKKHKQKHPSSSSKNDSIPISPKST